MTFIYNKKGLDLPLLSLLVVNAMSIVGVFLFDWSLLQIVFLYWAESAVIGFYNILKMFKLESFHAIPSVVIFIACYGLGILVHLGFIRVIFGMPNTSAIDFPFDAVTRSLMRGVAFPIMGLFVSHGISYSINFIGREEYKNTNISKQKWAPVSRIIVMHLTVMFAALLVTSFKAPTPAFVGLITLKTIADFYAHAEEHKKLAA